MRTRHPRRTHRPAALLATATTSVALLALGAAPALAATTIGTPNATNVSTSGATVAAPVTAGSTTQTITVHYGPDGTALSQTATATPATVAANESRTVTATLTGLTPNTKYDVEFDAAPDNVSGSGSFSTLVVTNPGATPDAGRAISYLTAPANLIEGTHYEGSYVDSQGQTQTYTDYGDTINTAFGLAAAGTDNSALQKIVDYLATNAADYDSLGTGYDSPGATGKLAVLVETVGENPRSFGGQDLIGGLDSLVCTTTNTDCAGVGAYKDVYSTLSQAFGILAQLRAGDTTGAASPIAYLESLQQNTGGWPSEIPSSGGSDVDSTAMADLALALAPGSTAAGDLAKGNAFLVSQQAPDGGFYGASGDSVNSTALALLSLNLAGSTYQSQITKGLAFLAAQQNGDGGFNAADGQPGSNILASSQALSGALLTPFTTLSDPYGGPAPSLTVSSGPANGATYPSGTAIPALAFSCAPASGAALASRVSGCSARVDGGGPQPSAVTLPTGVGAHTVVLTATDTDDRYAIRTITYQVTAPTTSTRVPAPRLGHLTESHSTWRASDTLASIARTTRSAPVGTTFGFTLNEPATVTLTFTRHLGGRRIGHFCEHASRANRHRPRCTTTLSAKLTLRGGTRGVNRVKFYGRLSRRVRLGTGTYTVAITATAGGHTSSGGRLRFTIL